MKIFKPDAGETNQPHKSITDLRIITDDNSLDRHRQSSFLYITS